MKKLMILCLTALLITAFSAPAFADVIWAPNYDDFFSAHADECDYVNARFEARTDCAVYKSPEELSAVSTIHDGEIVYIGYTWTNGAAWGYYEFVTETAEGSGWVELSGLRRLYGSEDFAREHAGDIAEQYGEISRSEYPGIILWTFPGSGEDCGLITADVFDWSETEPAYHEVYTDEDGNTWGHVFYYYGETGWVYLTDPAADELPATGPRYADGEADEDAPAATPDDYKPLGPVVAVVVAVVAVTAALIALFGGKSERRKR